jgi:hypothetical protein
MKFNKNSIKSLSAPWFETDLSKNFLKKKKISKDLRKQTNLFIKNGYLVLRNVISKKLINNVVNDFNKIINSNQFKKNPDYFHYNKHPRVIEGWKKSKNIKAIAKNTIINNYFKFFYNKNPLPISTINFYAGTEQPLHSDYIHFGSVPELYLAGAWFALENVNKNNGPLTVVPGSHKLKIVSFSDFNLQIPKTTKELKSHYSIYENYLIEIIKEKKMKTKKIFLQKGDVIIWAANLLHGGSKIIKKNHSRLSQVVHYHFDELDYVYNPCFSNKNIGIIAKRNLKELVIK